jgi:cyclopropane fatty-acyl-phospholipid synthase-like methyltransferase
MMASMRSDKELWEDIHLGTKHRRRIASHNVLTAAYLTQLKILGPNVRILEIGAGSGEFASLVAPVVASVTVLDYSSEAISRCRQLLGKLNNIDYVQEDLFTYTPEQKYDLVYSGGLLEHFFSVERKTCLQAHIRASAQYVLISVPADTPRNWERAIRNRYKTSEKQPDFLPLGERDVLQLFQEEGLELVSLLRIDETYGCHDTKAKLRRQMIRMGLFLDSSIGCDAGGLLLGLGRKCA